MTNPKLLSVRSVGRKRGWDNADVTLKNISLHAPESEAPGIWQIWNLEFAGRGDRQICWWCTLGWDTLRVAWRTTTGSGGEQDHDEQRCSFLSILKSAKSGSYRLICLCAALVTRVRSHRHHGLDLSGPGHDASDGHQVPDTVCPHVTHHFWLCCAGGLEVELAVGNPDPPKYINTKHSFG